MVKMPTSVRVSPSDASGNTLVQAGRPTLDAGNGTSKQWPGLLKVVIGLSIGQVVVMTVIVAVLGSFLSSHGSEIDRLKTMSGKVDEAISSNIHQMTMVQLLNDSISDRLSNIEIDLNWQATVIDQIKENRDDENRTTHYQSARIDKLETKLKVNQRIISNHTDTIEVIQKQSHDQNSSLEMIRDKVVELESVIAADQYLSVNNTDKIKQLEEILNEQNTSIVRVDKKISNLQINQELDQNSFKELKENVYTLEGNIKTYAIMQQNLSSHLKVIDHEMSMVADMVHIQQVSQERFKENMTALSIDFISFHYSLKDLEARTNASEFSWLHNENRIEKLELSHSLETVLNLEQEATINQLEEELNKTVAIMQGFIEGATETPVNGGWSSWSTWTSCTHTCNAGQKERQRTCDNPVPVGSGRTCTGNSNELSICSENPCPDTKSTFSIYHGKLTYDTTTNVLRFPSPKHELNIGGNFNTATGIFTCQYRGTYVFVLNLYRYKASGSRVRCWLRKNSSTIAYANASKQSEDNNNAGSGSAVVHLEPGDTVYVGYCIGTDNIDWNTSFMGFLLQAD